MDEQVGRPPAPPPPLLEVPDLDLGPVPSPVSRRAPVGAAAATPPVSSAVPPRSEAQGNKAPSLAPPAPPAKKAPAAPRSSPSDGFDDDFASAQYGAIDLDLGANAPPNVALGAAAPSHRPEAAPVSMRAHDVGGRIAAERLADYGPSPSSWWQAPAYAYRVKMRQTELRRALAGCREGQTNAQTARDDAWVVFAERNRKAIAQAEAYAPLLRAVTSAETALLSRDGALAAETDAHRRQTATIDERLLRVEQDLRAAKTDEAASAERFEAADAVRQRAEAKVKRAEIDLRNLAARGAGPNSRRSSADLAPPSARNAGPASSASSSGVPSDAEILAKTAERDARQAELAQTLPAVKAAAEELTATRRRVTTVAQEALSAKNERAALEREFQKRGASHNADVTKAAGEVRQAMIALGRAASADRNLLGEASADARAELAGLEKTAQLRADEVDLHVAALRAYDAEKLKTGIMVVAGAVALAIALTVVPLVMSLSAKPKPPPPTVDVQE